MIEKKEFIRDPDWEYLSNDYMDDNEMDDVNNLLNQFEEYETFIRFLPIQLIPEGIEGLGVDEDDSEDDYDNSDYFNRVDDCEDELDSSSSFDPENESLNSLDDDENDPSFDENLSESDLSDVAM